MPNNNKTFTILMYVVGVLVTLILVIGAPFLVTSVISNDEKSRQRDTDIEQRVDTKVDKLQEELYIKFDKMIEAQNKVNISIAKLEEMVKRIQ